MLNCHPVSLERPLDVCDRVLQAHTRILVALIDPLHEPLRHLEQLLLTCLPHTHHDSARCNAYAYVLCCSLL